MKFNLHTEPNGGEAILEKVSSGKIRAHLAKNGYSTWDTSIADYVTTNKGRKSMISRLSHQDPRLRTAETVTKGMTRYYVSLDSPPIPGVSDASTDPTDSAPAG